MKTRFRYLYTLSCPWWWWLWEMCRNCE